MKLGRVFFCRILLGGFLLVFVWTVPYLAESQDKGSILSALTVLMSFFYGPQYADLPYLILLITLGIIGFGLIANIYFGKRIGFRISSKVSALGLVDKVSSNILIFIWVGIVLSWFYGVAVGYFNEVPESQIFRNFFGLLVYLMFPFLLLLLPSLKSIIYVVLFGGLIQTVYAIDFVYREIGDLVLIFQSQLVRYVYSAGFFLIFPIYTLSFAYFIFPRLKSSNSYFRITKSIRQNVIIFLIGLITLISLIIPAYSKGFFLALFLLSGLIFSASICEIYRSGKVSMGHLIVVFLYLVFNVYLFSSFDTFLKLYSSAIAGNVTRSVQFDYIIADLNLFGRGLGSLVKGYNVGGRSYGLELSYLNLIHKFGVFTIFILISYFLTIFVSLYRMIKGVFLFEAVFVLGLMAYLVVGIGNPILVSSITVTLHCIAMYVLVSPYLKPL